MELRYGVEDVQDIAMPCAAYGRETYVPIFAICIGNQVGLRSDEEKHVFQRSLRFRSVTSACLDLAMGSYG